MQFSHIRSHRIEYSNDFQFLAFYFVDIVNHAVYYKIK